MNKLEEILKDFDDKFTETCENGEVLIADYRNGKLILAGEIKDWLSIKLKEYALSLLPEEKDNWKYGGGGGIDADHWCKRGVCFTIPGIKQIVSYGIKNDSWWAKYLFKWEVIIPEKYFNNGYNACLKEIKDKIK